MMLWLLCWMSFAESKMYKTPAQGVQRIVIQAGQIQGSGKLRVIEEAGSAQFIVRMDGKQSSGLPTMRVENASLIIEASNVPWDIEVRGPSVVLDASWLQGEVSVENWRAPIKLAGQKLQTRISGGEGGEVKVFSDDGKATVENRKSRVQLDGSTLEMNVQNCEGEVALGAKSAKILAAGNQGPIQLESYQGTAQLKQNKGTLEFHGFRTAMNLEKHGGSVRGDTTEGAIQASLQEPVDFRVQSKEGRVSVSVPQGVGATVVAETSDADILVPNTIQVKRDEDKRLARGELPGNNKGFVSVKTDSSLIRIKTE